MEPIPDEQFPRAAKAEPLCPVFGTCQGCLYQDLLYPDELKIKEQRLRGLLKASLNIPDERFLPIVPSPKPYYYRNRLDLKLKRTSQDGILIGFTPADHRGVLPVEACYIAEKSICGFIPELKKQAAARLTAKYRVANLVVRTGDDGRVRWGGIGRRSCALSPQDYFRTTINGRKIFYSLDTFFQANLSILPKLFDVLCTLRVWDPKPAFFDLYGGVGLFSIGLADQVRKAVVIEENRSSLEVARYNIEVNALKNIEIIGGKVEDELPRLVDGRDARGSVAMVDPPRAGLSPRVSEQLAGARGLNHLLYLSCDPESLARDLTVLAGRGWKTEQVIPLDFFPKTKHIETLVVLSGRA